MKLHDIKKAQSTVDLSDLVLKRLSGLLISLHFNGQTVKSLGIFIAA